MLQTASYLLLTDRISQAACLQRDELRRETLERKRVIEKEPEINSNAHMSLGDAASVMERQGTCSAHH